MSNTIIDSNGVERFLGNLMPTKSLAPGWVEYGAVPNAPLVPRSKWPELIGADTGPGDPFLQYVHDQDGIGMCNASATCSAMERSRSRQGLEFVAISGGDLYQRISGGVDRGSMLEDGLSASMKTGVASVAVTPYLDWRGENAGASQDRTRFRVLTDEAFICPTFDHCMSAVFSGFDLISGVMWYSNYEPDGEGWLPLTGSGQAGGHAVHGYKATMRNGIYGIWHKNSWQVRWGLNGLCVFHERMYAGPVGGWWAVRQVVTEEGDIPAPVA